MAVSRMLWVELGGPVAGTRVSTLLGAAFPLGGGLEKQQDVNGEGLRVKA